MNNDLTHTSQQAVTAIMNKNVITVSVDDSILDTEKLLTEHKLSFLPVMDINNQCFSIISDCDFVKFHHHQGDSKLAYIWEICSHSVIQIPASTNIEQAAKIMFDNKVHHLVICENKAIIGITSNIDLLRYFTN